MSWSQNTLAANQKKPDVYKRQAKDIVDGKEVAKDNIIPPTIVTKDNVDTVLDANSPY